MSFYHIQIHHKHNADEYKVNMSVKQLMTRIVEPYKSGTPIVLNGRTIELDLINRIRIFKTEDILDKTIKEFEEERERDTHPFKMLDAAPEWKAIETGEEVTDDFITGPPGKKKASEFFEQRAKKLIKPEAVATKSGRSGSDRFSDARENIDGEKTIFISHATKDKEIIDAFVDVILHGALSVPIDKIFCVSTDGTKIKSGADWRDSINKSLVSARVNFLIITPNYKKSEVCLNE